ncbi:hypothetical protein QBC46DRAFT_357973 [Diplogelasinospora grovesii]|uniref:NB-ARC domain-containing protein n=1 Tax=Diplogelasinospora grovesii TaxID=303347 RepID=A0AAN6N0X3_9PEZI|nr:hypothetical protein QBC46DRAFT_357973 [Diplogelasinospora grovesii]
MQEVGDTHGTECDVRVILVPGVGTPPAAEWDLFSDLWDTVTPSFSACTDVSFFGHGVLADQKFTFQQLVEAGNQLHDKVVKLCEAERRPLILVAHSLGGAILKQALCILNVRAGQFQEYQYILNLIAGVIFISCPHGTESPKLLEENCLFLFRQYSSERPTNQTLATIKAGLEGHMLGISRRFGGVRFGFDILTLYETRPTTRKSLVRSKRKIIVDKALAALHARREREIGLDADHTEICKLVGKNKAPFTGVLEWLRSMIDAAPSKVEERFQAHDARLSQSLTPSLRTQASIEVLRKAFSKVSVGEEDDSKAAHKGSLGGFSKDMSTIFEKFSPTSLTVKLPCFMLDKYARNKDFFGRQEIMELIDESLLPNNESVSSSAEPGSLSILALRGMPGLGKTEIALEYVFTRRDKFDAIFWVCADKDATLESDFCRIAATLGLKEEGTHQNPVITKETVKNWLSSPRRVIDNADDTETYGMDEATWLLVLDNADQPDLLHDYLQIYGRGSILITSRDPSVKECYPPMKEIELEPFSDQEAAEFLQSLTRKSVTTEDDRQISHYLGGLPLAIAQMAGVIRKQLLSMSEFRERLEDPEERSELYDLFVTKDANKRTLLLPMKKGEYHGARAQLLHSSIIRRNEENDLWIHRVPQQVVRSTLEGDRSRQAKAYHFAVRVVQSAWPVVAFENRHTKDRSPICERLFPHVITLKECYDPANMEIDGGTEHDLACVFQEASWWLYERGNLVRARPIAELALSICKKHVSSDEPRWLDRLSLVYDVLGRIANGTNKPRDSMAFNSELLVLRKRIAEKAGQQDFPLAYAHNQAGCAWMIAKDYQQGCTLFTEALRIWHSMPAYRKGIASMEYANLGLSYWLLGNLDKASEVLEEGLREREEGFGKNDAESFRPGRILHALGNVRASQGRYQESEDFHQRAMRTYQAAVGPKYHRTADMCHKLAQHCVRRGDRKSLDDAKKFLDQALSIWAANPEAHKPEIARSTFLKAKVLFLQNSDEAVHVDEISLFETAVGMIGDLTPSSPKEPKDLSEADFDDLVTFWSR